MVLEMLAVLLIVSTVIWYVTDKFKVIWEASPYSRYFTMLFVAILGAAAVLTLGLDILVIMGAATVVSVIGQILTVLVLMTGSSAVAEVTGNSGDLRY